MYRGPEPPVGPAHRYRLVVYLLDANLHLEAGLFSNTVLDTIKGHIIGEGEIATTYQRTP